jgi:hypothetical protein
MRINRIRILFFTLCFVVLASISYTHTVGKYYFIEKNKSKVLKQWMSMSKTDYLGRVTSCFNRNLELVKRVEHPGCYEFEFFLDDTDLENSWLKFLKEMVWTIILIVFLNKVTAYFIKKIKRT